MNDSNEQISLTAPDHNDAPQDILPPLDLPDLSPALQQACARAGWTELMPVQRHALPYMLRRQDIMVQSRTGSGKTGAYLLPLLEHLNPAEQAVQALILTPTRELAVQVEREAASLFAETGLGVVAVYGGVGYDKQIAALRKGVGVVIGTPGRILDHLLRRTLRLDNLRSLVFDEADRMLSIGFYPDMKQIQRYLPDRPVHATLFSATYPPHVLRLAGEFLREPELLSLSGDQVHVAAVQHAFCECKSMGKDRTLLRLIEMENPTSAIIFCNTKANVHFITAVLQGFGLSADELSADLTQSRREDVLNRLRKGQLRLLVATDVAARGIDIPDLSHVFLYEPPEDRESYIHRAGRTGRAGAAGMVISLVDVMQKLELDRIAQFYHIPLTPLAVPTDEQVAEALGHRVQAALEARFRTLGSLEKERVSRLETLAKNLAADAEQLPLLAMLLDETYQKCLTPDAETLPPAENGRPERKARPPREKAPRHRKENAGFGGKTETPPSSTGKTAMEGDSNAPNAVPRPEKTTPRVTDPLGELPPHLADLVDPNGLDIPEGMEDSLPPVPAVHKRRRRRRPRPTGANHEE